jgi:formate hydrogenlyase transcriptional activator
VPVSELREVVSPESVRAAGAGSGNGRTTTLEASEREHILKVLRETKGVMSGPNGAAARLGLKRTTLQGKMKKLGITRESF